MQNPNLMKIDQIIFEGRYIKTNNVMFDLRGEGKIGEKMGIAHGYSCPRCGKPEGIIQTFKSGNEYFCRDAQCLKIDSDASKGKYTPEPTKFNLTKLGIPTRYHNAHLTNWLAPTNIQKMIFEWINNPKNFLVHVGLPNCGKTFMCAALINYLIEQNKECYYAKADRVIQEMKALIESGKSEYTHLNLIAEKPILFIDGLDDIHLESDWQIGKLEELINRRYENMLPTVITSKLTQNQIESTFGQGLKGKLFNRENKVFEKWTTT